MAALEDVGGMLSSKIHRAVHAGLFSFYKDLCGRPLRWSLCCTYSPNRTKQRASPSSRIATRLVHIVIDTVPRRGCRFTTSTRRIASITSKDTMVSTASSPSFIYSCIYIYSYIIPVSSVCEEVVYLWGTLVEALPCHVTVVSISPHPCMVLLVPSFTRRG